MQLQDKQEKKKKIKNMKIRRGVLSFTLSLFFIDSELRQKQDGRRPTPLTSKNVPELKIARNCVNPTLVTCASNKFRAELKYSNCLVSFSRKENRQLTQNEYRKKDLF